ncbi:MAG: hypothetical protein PVG49_02945 [Desulfobacteraceae bacterium]|jgi:hypothetical protein
MPVYLENRDVFPELAGYRSVLIVPCRVCPAISLAVAQHEAYLELLTHFLGTPAYGRAVSSLESGLRYLGIRTGVFQSDFPVPMMCMWSSWQRRRLLKRARQYEAAVVLGCDSAVRTVEEIVGDTAFRVFQGMEVKGIIRVTPKLNLPCNIILKTESNGCVTWPEPHVAGQTSAGTGEEEPARSSG